MRVPRVSIVLPAYNHEAYVADAILSVLNQTFSDFELIIINDGSTDHTEREIHRFDDPRIRSFRQENRGLSATLNRGLSLAMGEFFGFLPSDDLYEPEKLALQVAILDGDPEVGLVFGYQNLIDATGAPLTDDHLEAWFRVPYETKEEIFPALFERNFLAAPSVLMRKACVDRVGGFDESLSIAQDYDLWLRALKHYGVRLLKDPVIRYRWHGGNLTFRPSERTEAERAIVLLRAYRDLRIEDIFPSLRTVGSSDRSSRYADAYERLAGSVERSGLPGLVPVAALHRIEAGHWRSEQGAGQRVSDVERDPASQPFRGRSEKVGVLLEVRSLDTGGLEEVVFNLARALPRERFNVLIVCVERGGRVARRCREHGIFVETLGENREQEYRELLDRHGIDLVCAHYSTFGAPLAAGRGIPFISVVHNLYAWLPDDVFSEIKAGDHYVSKYVAVSEGVARYLTGRFNIASEKVTVIQNGMDVEALAAREREPLVHSRSNFDLAEEDYVFLHVAAITEVKGHNVLIRAMKEIIPRYPRIKVLCVGEGLAEGYSDLIKGRVKEWGLEGHVVFAGFVDRITDLYRLADAFVLPSIIEGWSLAVGEAMFFGLPLILTRVGSAEAIIEGSDLGKLIEPSCGAIIDLEPEDIWRCAVQEDPPNVGQLVEAMTDFYNRRVFWRKAGRKGRRKVLQRYTLQRAAKQYEDLFLREVLRGRREREREYLRRLQYVGDLEEVNRRLTETRALLETLQSQQARHIADLEARQQARLEAIGQQILDRLSVTTRVKARLAQDLGALEELLSQIGRRLYAQLDEGLRAIRARIPFGLKRWMNSRIFGSALRGAQRRPVNREDAYRRRVQRIIRQRDEMTIKEVHRLALNRILSESRSECVAIYPPTLIWGEHLFQRPHQIFRSLAKRGILSLFCSSNPSSDRFEGFKQVGDRLFLCSDVNALRLLNDRVEVIVWMTRPDHRGYRGLFPAARTIYEMIDELEVFSEYCDAMERDHERAVTEADVVVATATTLHQRIRAIRGDVLLAPNGVCIEDFQVDPQLANVPIDMEKIVRAGRPIIGYYGALAEWLDYDLVNGCAEACGDLSFVFIGPDYDGSAGRLQRRGNVFWLGPKRYSELKHYLYWFDVATIPFQINRITESTSPIKLFEYMAGGKPIVTTALPECRPFRSVLVAESREHYVQQLRIALGKRRAPDYLESLHREAEENTWDARIASILAALGPSPLAGRFPSRDRR